MDFLRDHLQEAPQGMILVSDGERIYGCKSDHEVMDLLKQGQGMFSLPVDRVWTELEKSVGRKAVAGS